jgi:heptosyltransferase-2
LFAARELWSRDIDLAISPRWESDGVFAASGILAYLSGAQRRLGFTAAKADRAISRVTRQMSRLVNEGPLRPALKHEVEFRNDILAALGQTEIDTRLEVWTSPADDAVAERLCSAARGQLVAFGPGAGWEFRCWPAASFAELGARLQREHSCSVILIGGASDTDRCRSIAAKLNGSMTIDAAGLLTLRETAAVLKRCVAFVGNDSGPLHIAAAAGVPVVGLYGPGVYQRFRPWGGRSEMVRLGLPCSPCPEQCLYDRPYCMEDIAVDAVEAALCRVVEPLWGTGLPVAGSTIGANGIPLSKESGFIPHDLPAAHVPHQARGRPAES